MGSFDSVIDALAGRARDTPDATAFAVGDECVSYGALLEQARALAGAVSACGLPPGGRVAILLPTSLDFIRVLFAVQGLGGVPVAVNPGLPAEAIDRRLAQVRADLAVVSHETRALLGSRPGGAVCRLISIADLARHSGPGATPFVRPSPEAVAFLQFTSGTSGEPRAAVTLHRQLTAWIALAGERLDVRPSDRLASWVPLHYGMGLVRFVFGALMFGCPAHLVPASIANLDVWLRTLSRVRATITGCPDTGYRLAARLVRPEGLDLGALRVATNGGETVRVSTIEQFQQRFHVRGAIRPVYGLAEATLGVADTAPGEHLRVDAGGTVSSGRPYRGVEVRIAAPDGSDVPLGADGEIVVRGETVFAGYFDDPVATSEVLRGGWLHTGDVGSLDGDGYLFVRGRARVLIKRGGALIAPREVEDAVDRVAGVQASAAVGIPRASAAGTEELVVVAEVEPDTTPDSARHLTERIVREVVRAIGAAPQVIHLVAPGSIPRTATGKTRYPELRRLVEGGELDDRLVSAG